MTGTAGVVRLAHESVTALTALAPLQSSAQAWSRTFATILAVAFLFVLAILIAFNKWNRPDLDPEHAIHILAQLDTFGGTRGATVVRSPDELDDPGVMENIRGNFLGDTSSETTVRSATREVVREVWAETRSRSPPVSKVPYRALQEAFVTALFGSIAVLPIAVWRQAVVTRGFQFPDLADVASALATGVDIGLSAAASFPFAEVLFSFALTFGILGAQTVYNAWLAPPVVLAALAITYWALERKLETDRDLSGPSIAAWSARLVTLTILTWGVGAGLMALHSLIPSVWVFTVPPGLFRIHSGFIAGALLAGVLAGAVMYVTRNPWWAAGFAVIGAGIAGEVFAFLAALTVAAVVTKSWVQESLYGWRMTAKRDGRDALALDVVHSLTITAAALTLPLMVSYIIAAFWTRKALTVAQIIITAPPATLYAVILLAVMVALAAAIAFADTFSDVRRGFRRAMSVQSVRTMVFARGFPVTLMVITAVLTASFRVGIAGVVASALAVGFIARFGVMAYNQVTYRVAAMERGEGGAARVVINGRRVTDADGEPVYVADVNGHRTAHRHLDPLISQVRRDVRALFRDGAPESGSFARYYYLHGVRRGKVDLESLTDELLGDVRTRFVANVKQSDADADTILDKLRGEYPDNVVDGVVSDLKRRGRVTRRDDGFQWLG